jgi:hypothetical protein
MRPPEQAMDEQLKRLTWREICERFPDEWVVVVDADWQNENDFDFGTAVVVGHHRSRKDASPSVRSAFRSHAEVGCFWTGRIRGPVPRFLAP